MEHGSRLKHDFGRWDIGLALVGTIGLLLMLFAAPQEHPHSAATSFISKEQAIDSARAFAQRSGALHLADSKAEASIRYDAELLNDMQKRHGRVETLRMLRDDSVHAYVWRIEWERTDDDETEDLGWARVTLDGRPLGLRIEPEAIPRQAYHEGALSELSNGSVPIDSLPPNRFAFRLDSPPRGGPLSVDALQVDRIVLDSADAVRMALYHLRQAPFANNPMRIDSVYASGSDGMLTATVRVEAEDGAADRFFSAAVEVAPGGTLVRMEPRFVPEEDDSGTDGEDIQDIATFTSYILLALILVIIFFRRLNARIVDTKTAIRDGLAAGVAAAVTMATQMSVQVDGNSPMETIGIILGMLMVGLLGGILIFFMSGASLSMARERWDEKLQTLALFRSMYVRNVPVGMAVVRGVFAGLALVGIASLLLLLFDGIWLHFSDSGDAFFGDLSPGMAVLRDMGGTFFMSFFLTLAGVVGIGALFLRKKGSTVVAFVVVVVVLALLQFGAWSLRPMPIGYVVYGLYGAVAAAVFWRYDALTTFATLFVFLLLSPHVSHWSAPAAPEFIDAVVTLGIVILLGVFGFVGVMSRKRSSEVPVIVPEYIKELAQQERLKRELELAREVQLSFLPARTPDVLGLDIASVCLAAYEVGGDYYDFFRMDDKRLGVVVGDVSGKGMQAAFYMTLMKGILQSLNTRLTRPSAILAGANEVFRLNAPRGTFMSIVLGILDLETRTWTCARAGHNPMLLHRAGAEQPEEVKPRGAAIGLASDPTFSLNIEETTIQLEPGDLLLIYTDGITEAMNGHRELFDERRLDESVARARGRSASDVLAAVIKDVEQFTGDAPRHDDMTMVAIRVLDHEPK